MLLKTDWCPAMPPNARVILAFKAMRALGIPEETTKPVLRNLFKLYDKNWELIEEENYRALADAIFEYEETKVAEERKKIDNSNQEREDHVAEEREDEVIDEPERPLKRLRLKYQEGHASGSAGNSSMALIVPKLESGELPESTQQNLRNKGPQPVPNSTTVLERSVAEKNQLAITSRMESDTEIPQLHLRNKGKEPLVSQKSPAEKGTIPPRSSHAVRIQEPTIDALPKQKVRDPPQLIRPKDEPYTDDIAQFEVPIAVVHPEQSSKGGSSTRNNSVSKPSPIKLVPSPSVSDNNDRDDSVPVNKTRTNSELTCVSEPPNLEIASSTLGDVKISLSCNSAFERHDFHVPNLEAVMKMVEEKCLRSYKILDPNFSVTKLMKDMCDCFLELGTEPNKGTEERQVNITPVLDSLMKSPARDLVGGPSSSLNGPLNALNECIIPDENINENGFGEKEKEDDGYSNSHSLVVGQQNEISPDDLRTMYDVNDITKGEERNRVSLVNELNSEYPASFHYIPQNIVFQNAYVNVSLARIGDEGCCSSCFGDCLSSAKPCACSHETAGEFAYELEGVVKEEFLEECLSINRDPQKQQSCLFYCKHCPLEMAKNDDISEPCKGHLRRRFIKECWSKCGCSKQCGNRVVQRGITCNLQVFLTPEGKGWGLRALEELPKGSFVCEYVGEILTSTELYERIGRSTSSGNQAYPVLLDANWGSEMVLKEEEALCLDATFYGNVARFINHRCLDANLIEIPVEVETPNHNYYHLAFFTTRKVDALEELTWDYGIDFDDHDHPVKAFRCRCGSKFCRNMKRSNRSRSTLIVK